MSRYSTNLLNFFNNSRKVRHSEQTLTVNLQITINEVLEELIYLLNKRREEGKIHEALSNKIVIFFSNCFKIYLKYIMTVEMKAITITNLKNCIWFFIL